MNASRTVASRASLLAVLTVAALPGAALAADAPDPREQAREEARRIEFESRRLQQQGQRQMQAQERSQQEALRGQEEAIRRLEEARRRLEESSREVAQLSTQVGRDFSYSYSTTGARPRAILGVQLGNARDPNGAIIMGVSPGGPAAEAGIRTGDVISHVDGLEVSKQPNAEQAVVEKMAQVTPETKVAVTVLRDGKPMEFEVVARAAPTAQVLPFPTGGARNFQVPPIDILRTAGPMGGSTGIDPIADRQLFVINGDTTRLGGTEFATLSERLGSYFGVKSGVLVVRAGANSPYSLQDGDVILAIDGREPTSAQHAGRILRSYQPGEQVKLRVQRDRKAMDVNAAAPGASREGR